MCNAVSKKVFSELKQIIKGDKYVTVQEEDNLRDAYD